MKHDLIIKGNLTFETYTVQTVSELAQAALEITRSKAKLAEFCKVHRLTLAQTKCKTKNSVVETFVIESRSTSHTMHKEQVWIIDFSEIGGGSNHDS